MVTNSGIAPPSMKIGCSASRSVGTGPGWRRLAPAGGVGDGPGRLRIGVGGDQQGLLQVQQAFGGPRDHSGIAQPTQHLRRGERGPPGVHERGEGGLVGDQAGHLLRLHIRVGGNLRRQRPGELPCAPTPGQVDPLMRRIPPRIRASCGGRATATPPLDSDRTRGPSPECREGEFTRLRSTSIIFRLP